MSESFRVRDGRNFGLFIIEDELIDKYGPQLGVYGVAVYTVLARHANGQGEAIMSAPAIASRLGCGDRKVRDVLQQLVDMKLITRKPNYDDTGARTADTITLHNITPMHDVQGPPARHAPKITTTAGGALDAPANDAKPKPIVRVWEEETRQIVTLSVAEALYDYEDDFGYEWVVDAIKEAVATLGVGRIGHKYILGILTRWRDKGRDAPKPNDNGNEPPPQYKRILT